MADAGPLRDIRIQLKTRMDKAVEDFRKAMAATRTGRASVHMLDGVTVDYYGSQMPLNQIAQVHAPESQLITVQPFDPTALASIEKGIRTADLGLNPMNDGKMVIRGTAGIFYARIPGLVLAGSRSTNGSIGQELDRNAWRSIR